MGKGSLVGAAACVVLCFSTLISASTLWYSAKITNKDRYNSSGKRLSTVRAILRQDRANVHKYAKADSGDHSEIFFKSSGNRKIFSTWRMSILKGFGEHIIHGKTPVYVTVGVDFSKHIISVAPTG